MHYSITHEAHSMGIIDKMGTAGPYNKLLRDEVNNLCLICHDQRGGGPMDGLTCWKAQATQVLFAKPEC